MNTGIYSIHTCSGLFTAINAILLPRCYPENGDALLEKAFNQLINNLSHTKINEKWFPGSSRKALSSFGAVLERFQSNILG
jgi:hypothetical protein